MKNKAYLYLGSIFTLISIFILATSFYNKSQQEELSFLASKHSQVFVRDYSPRLGPSKAKVFLTEFLDPECESCRVFYPEVKKLMAEFKDQVQLVIRYAPFHKNSEIAIRALEAARMQGRYWEALGLLFYYQPNWGSHHNPRPELIFTYLQELGLNMDKLEKDMKDPKIDAIIEQDQNDLKILNVRKTPTFFVNGKRLEKFGVTHLRDLLHKEVSQQY